MTNSEIRAKIEELADEKYREFHGGLCPEVNGIIGVRVPLLRNLGKEIAKEDWKEYLDNAVDNSYEEIMLQGMVIGLSKMKIEQFQYYLKKFIPKIDNWAICDTTIAGLKLTKKYRAEMLEFIKEYLKSDKEFEIRFAVVMLLDFFVVDNYIDDVLQILNQVNHTGYYVKMGVAWAISICFIKYPEKTMELLKNNNLDNFTYNKALQKITESYRVDKITKNKIRNMKRK